jgi:hypothetical protein
MTPLEGKLLIEKLQDYRTAILVIEDKVGKNYDNPEELRKINNSQVHKLKLNIMELLDNVREAYYKKDE